ncbi:type VI secretion system protein TssA [Pseudomonas nitroreducens]|uniref:Type VI secretion protein ImpA n=1 Tax=Pseudomonas nitroreducens TaxID=46680 RepID=A0A246F9X4_PSENT|nr:type VI secretion system protein TssA [Pseudomonas nitroreducens]OWP51099.1 type VI secretion protein ImpA [Pseudomonas nitroreducens]
MDGSLLLASISESAPCGVDLEYDSEFLQLERDAQGRPERSMGDVVQAAEPPDWRAIEQASSSLLQRSKDLRITHFLVQSSLALEGLEGLAARLTLVSELLSRYWAELYPRLDADDDNDPTVRVNTLAGLTCDTNLALLRNAVLLRSRVFGTVTLRAALNAAGLLPASDEALSADELNGALRDSDPAELEATRAAIQSALEAAQAIERQVAEQVGSDRGVDLQPLRQPLKLALQVLGDSTQPTADSIDEAAPQPHADTAAAAPSAPPASGEIRNRDDVRRSLDRLLEYYARHEPSSPLPVLLNRARTLVDADFASIVRNLIPDGISQFENLRGPDADQA